MCNINNEILLIMKIILIMCNNIIIINEILLLMCNNNEINNV